MGAATREGGIGSADPLLIIAASEVDSNLYYATHFLAPDPFIFLEVGGKTLLLMSDLELDRAKAESRVDEVRAFSVYEEKAKARWTRPHLIDTLSILLEECGVHALTVPSNFPVEYADRLREKGVSVAPKPEPLFPQRLIKREEEVQAIEESQRHTEAALEAALQLLRESAVKGDRVMWKAEVVTAELLKKVINVTLMERECVAQHTIVAPGIQGCDPHNRGSGPIRPNESIVFDIFPRSGVTRYFADMTRTVVKGRASDELKRLYDAVLAAQERGIELIRDGVSGQMVHQEVTAVMEQRGYHTGMVDGRMQGFFHGTGHGVGLDIHEPPRISKTDNTLQAGQVVTVEPGLYYLRWGAVRIEDMVLVESNGCKNLTRFPKFLELV
ncbi:MAG TPA: Xaa-Pro peptidase family protein [Methylomirabilota bacterium]|nr:Xaa-Pro peptidase family protein [Methylomirabilota bacterium]